MFHLHFSTVPPSDIQRYTFIHINSSIKTNLHGNINQFHLNPKHKYLADPCFKKKQNQKKTNTFNKSQKKKRHQQQQLTLEIAFDLFHSLCRPKKTSHQKHRNGNSKTPRPLNCERTVSELIQPPSLECQHLEASRCGNRYLRCSVWNRLVCAFCRKVIS